MKFARRLFGWRVTLASAFFLVAGRAAADSTSPQSGRSVAEAIRVELEAPAGCGDAGSFFAAVRARTDRVRPSEGRGDERLFSVRITSSSLGFEGRLSVVEPGGQRSERRIAAESCAEVVDALAIVAAFAADPNAKEPDPARPVSSALVTAPSPPSAPAATAVSAPAETPRVPPNNQTESRRSDSSSMAWFVGVQVALEVAVPDPLYFPTGALTGDVAWDRSSIVSPSVRLALRRSLEATATSSSGRATFALTTIRLEPCPIQLRFSAAVRFLPCAVLEGGLVTAQGHDVNDPHTRDRPWSTAGVAMRLSMGAGSPRFEVEAGIVAALIRDTFQFVPDESVYRVSGLIPFVAAGIGFGRAGEP